MLPKRFGKFGPALHPDKTRRVDFPRRDRVNSTSVVESGACTRRRVYRTRVGFLSVMLPNRPTRFVGSFYGRSGVVGATPRVRSTIFPCRERVSAWKSEPLGAARDVHKQQSQSEAPSKVRLSTHGTYVRSTHSATTPIEVPAHALWGTCVRRRWHDMWLRLPANCQQF